VRIAILTESDDVYVAFPEETFRELLKTYFQRTGDIDAALDQIIIDLKKQTLYK